jgi:hypothetical protein
MSRSPDWIEYFPALHDKHAEEPAAMTMMSGPEKNSNPRKVLPRQHKKVLSNT